VDAHNASTARGQARRRRRKPPVSHGRTVEPAELRATGFRFPDGFLWGAATSAHQVEGGCDRNDWWAWEEAGRVRQRSGAACDHYHRFREDFDLARSLHHNAHRLSLEWSRIEPEEGRYSEAEIGHYREVLRALVERGIEPVVTLLHFTLPRWLAERGGWEHPAIESLFERLVTRVVGEYRHLARRWITINEPVVAVYKGYLIGEWPPGVTSYPRALMAVRRMLRTHVRAYHAIHAVQPEARVGIAQHMLELSICDPWSLRDRLSTQARDFLMNFLFLDALDTGALRVPGLFWERLPMRRTLDFIGINYYTRDFVRNGGFDLPGLLGSACKLDHHQQVGKRSSLGWEVYPEGLGRFLHRLKRFGLPVLITENGISTGDDEDRWTFLVLHLWQVARAISDGVPVAGYLHWSLLDNFEWADGYDARFGLVGVDYATQRRTVRESARRLGEIMATNRF
jgi:beta-glucosidase